MKRIYILAVFILLLGLLYLVTGVWGIVTVTNLTADCLVLKSIIPTMAMLIFLGGLTLYSAIGIIIKNSFVRKFWLGFSIFLLAIHLLWLASDIRHGTNVTDVVEPLVILLLVLASWKMLRSEEVSTEFAGKNGESSNNSIEAAPDGAP